MMDSAGVTKHHLILGSILKRIEDHVTVFGATVYHAVVEVDLQPTT